MHRHVRSLSLKCFKWSSDTFCKKIKRLNKLGRYLWSNRSYIKWARKKRSYFFCWKIKNCFISWGRSCLACCNYARLWQSKLNFNNPQRLFRWSNNLFTWRRINVIRFIHKTIFTWQNLCSNGRQNCWRTNIRKR